MQLQNSCSFTSLASPPKMAEEEAAEETKVIEPNYTLYINNIDEKIPKEGACKLHCFSELQTAVA